MEELTGGPDREGLDEEVMLVPGGSCRREDNKSMCGDVGGCDCANKSAFSFPDLVGEVV